jgi:hypothetical protein
MRPRRRRLGWQADTRWLRIAANSHDGVEEALRGHQGRTSLTTKPAEELDGRIAAAFSEDAKSGDVARLLAEVKEATSAAELAAETARKHALDPLLSGDDLKLARREMDDAAFKQDRLQEASAKLAERVEALKALEADGRMWEEHERVLVERDQLAEAMERMANPIVQIAHTVRRIEICDREIGRLNATSTSRFGYIRIVLSGAAPAITTLFQDALVWTRSWRSRGCSRCRLCLVG